MRLLVSLAISLLGSASACAQNHSTTMPAPGPLEIQLLFPGSQRQGDLSTRVPAAAGRELLTLRTSDGTKIVAVFTKSATWKPSDPKPTILFFYGNGMCMADSLPIYNHIRSLGFNVAMADYQGYGMSDGTPSEAGCYATADALYDAISTRTEIDPKRIISAGFSLGAAVAIDLANRKPVAGLASFSAFTNRAEMRKTISNRVPIDLLLSSRFDNLAKFKTIQCPIFMAHGTADRLIPFTMMDRLKRATTMPVSAMPVANAGHNDLFQIGGNDLYDRFKAFVNQPTVNVREK